MHLLDNPANVIAILDDEHKAILLDVLDFGNTQDLHYFVKADNKEFIITSNPALIRGIYKYFGLYVKRHIRLWVAVFIPNITKYLISVNSLS